MRPVLAVVAAVGGLAALTGTILGSCGGVWWAFDLLANFRLQYLLALALAAVALAAMRLPRLAAVLAIGAMFNGALIAPLYLRRPAPPTGGDRLEIVGFNTQLSNPRRPLAWIAEQDADLVVLFETSRRYQEMMGEMDTGFVITDAIGPDEAYGITILAPGPVAFRRLEPAERGGDAIRFQAPLGDATVTVYAIHPPSPSNPFRSTARDRFLAEVGRSVAAEPGPVAVVGDFNATPWSNGFREVSRPARLVNSQEGFGYAGTWPATVWPPLRIPLDHLLHTRDLTVTEREVSPETNSDHRGIRVVLAPADD